MQTRKTIFHKAIWRLSEIRWDIRSSGFRANLLVGVSLRKSLKFGRYLIALLENLLGLLSGQSVGTMSASGASINLVGDLESFCANGLSVRKIN